MAAGRKTGGRKKGTPNKANHSVKSNILAVFDKIGGRAAMARWAKENQTEFYRLYARMAPQELTGPDGGPVKVQIDRDDAGLL